MLCDVSLLSLIPIVLVKSFAATFSLQQERCTPLVLFREGQGCEVNYGINY
jgi:hypothetical protein